MNYLEIFYKDFFEPPRKLTSQSPQKPKDKPSSNGKVRFHEEVRVKNIKAKGKNLPVATMYSLEDDEDEDEDYVDMVKEEDESEDDEDDLEDEDVGEGSVSLSGGSEDFEMGDEGEEESEESEEESEEGWTHREAIDRLKDDLFADDDELEESGMRMIVIYINRWEPNIHPFVKISPLTRRECLLFGKKS